MILARSYSHFSLLSAVPQVTPLIKNAKSKGYTSIALTDEDTTSGLIEFYNTCLKNEVKPVLGVTLRITNTTQEVNSFGRHQGFSKVAIIAKNQQGYRDLLKIVTTARLQKEDPNYHIDLEELAKFFQIQEGQKLLNFFVIITGNDHEFGNNLRFDRTQQAKIVLNNYIKKLGTDNILVELAMTNTEESSEVSQKLNLGVAAVCDQLKVLYIASPAPRYLEKDDQEPFQVILAIKKQVRMYDIKLEREFDLPSLEELTKKFDYLPRSIKNLIEVDNQIDIKIATDYDSRASEAFFPIFPLPVGQKPGDRLAWESYIGLLTKFHSDRQLRQFWVEKFPYESLDILKDFVNRITPDSSLLLGYPKKYWATHSISEYMNRIDKELDIIISKGYPDYFLVLADIMQYSRDKGIVVNTRGSAAGCLVGYLTGINILDPLVYDIPFERFLNPMRPSAPDIDGDFADDRREEVIRYIVDKYGQDHVCQIITFGTMLPRAAVRDIGRVLGVSYRKCDQLSKLIPVAPQGRKTTFAWAFETSSELTEVYEKDSEVKRIIDIAKKIEANHRHASVHAAGVIISPTPLTDYTSLQWDSDHKMQACQYDMRYSEKAGLIKMDILGITNLSILGNAIESTQKRRNIKIDLSNIDLQDPKAFNLVAQGQTMGLFQLSGPAMTRYLVQLEPNKVQDLMAMVALYRPGPMANIPEYIRRKHNPKLIEYLHPKAREWMEPSSGVLVYQDDVLYLALYLAGYNWGEVDVLRKGMGKKIKEVIDSQHIKFVQGCQTHSGTSEEEAERIWAAIEPFSAYGFNKAHSANYGMVAYWTAYMKANYPAEFMTSLMTSEEGNMDKTAAALNECRAIGLDVRPPDVNKSFAGYAIENDQTIRYGLGSVKNLGSDVIKFIIKERTSSGRYKDMNDFLERVSGFQAFNKRSLEALITSGSLDELGAGELV